MMAFAIEKLGINIFQVKIGESNVESLSLFKKLVWPLLLFLYLFVHIKGMRCLRTVHLTYCQLLSNNVMHLVDKLFSIACISRAYALYRSFLVKNTNTVVLLCIDLSLFYFKGFRLKRWTAQSYYSVFY